MIIHLDCGFYSSAHYVLDFMTEFIQDGTMIILDDFLLYRGNPNYGVQRAFNKWIEKTGFFAHPYISYGWASRVFIINKP